MKVLITGGAGFIGSHTADLLLSKGYEVRVLDSLEPPVHPNGKQPDYLSDEVDFNKGDVRNRDDLSKALKGVDFVFHLAAYQGYRPHFYKFAHVNDGGTALLYEVIIGSRLPIRKVILGSSQAVYGEGKYRCREHGVLYPPPRTLAQLEAGDWEVSCPNCGAVMAPLLTDEHKVNPHNQYAISKYCQELYAINLGQRFNVPTVVMRYSITQGPRQSFHNAYSGILRIFATRLLNNLPPIAYEDGRQLRDYVYVGDVARANLLAIEDENMAFEVFNVGGDQTVTVLEYAALVQKITGKQLSLECRQQYRFGDTRHIFSDISKIKNHGWQPEVPLQEIIKEYIDWAQTQPDLADYYDEAEAVMQREGVIRSGVSKL